MPPTALPPGRFTTGTHDMPGPRPPFCPQLQPQQFLHTQPGQPPQLQQGQFWEQGILAVPAGQWPRPCSIAQMQGAAAQCGGQGPPCLWQPYNWHSGGKGKF